METSKKDGLKIITEITTYEDTLKDKAKDFLKDQKLDVLTNICKYDFKVSVLLSAKQR